MILRHPFAKRAAVLLALAAPLGLSACWLPPKEVIKEKAAARDAWRDQQKENKLAEAEGRAPRAIITVEQVEVLTGRKTPPPAAKAAPEVTSTPQGRQADSAQPKIDIDLSDADFETPDGPVPMAATAPRPVAQPKPAAKSKAPKAMPETPPAPTSGQVVLDEGKGTTARLVPPTSPLAANAPWMAEAAPETLSQLGGWRAAMERDSNAVIARGDGVTMAKGGRLFDLDAGLLFGALPPGLYDCRLYALNGEAAFSQSESRRCLVRLKDGKRRLSIITIKEIPVGEIHDNDAFSAVYLGQGLAEAMASETVVAGSSDSQAGLIQRVADIRWRLIIPGAPDGPTLVLELTRPRPVAGE